MNSVLIHKIRISFTRLQAYTKIMCNRRRTQKNSASGKLLSRNVERNAVCMTITLGLTKYSRKSGENIRWHPKR
jgi:hypothetical protein